MPDCRSGRDICVLGESIHLFIGLMVSNVTLLSITNLAKYANELLKIMYYQIVCVRSGRNKKKFYACHVFYYNTTITLLLFISL